jgi:Family of unknown function (DUF6521)
MSNLEPWSERQPDFANLFNPAFVGVLLRECCSGFHRVSSRGMSFPLCFVAPAMVLHPSVRNSLPRTVKARFSEWIRSDQTVRADLALAVKELVPVVRESLLIMISSGLLSLQAGEVVPGGNLNRVEDVTAALSPSLERSLFIGRWLARSGTTQSVFEAIGIRP